MSLQIRLIWVVTDSAIYFPFGQMERPCNLCLERSELQSQTYQACNTYQWVRSMVREDTLSDFFKVFTSFGLPSLLLSLQGRTPIHVYTWWLPPPTVSSPLPSHSGSLEPRLKELQESELEKSGFKAQRESCHPQQPAEASLSSTRSRTMKCGKGIATIATLPPVHCRLSKTTWGMALSVIFSAVLHRSAPQGPPCSSPTPLEQEQLQKAIQKTGTPELLSHCKEPCFLPPAWLGG